MAKKKKLADNVIAVNKRATFDYYIEQDFEAGLVLLGWEVKSLRMGKAQINGSHVVIRGGEAFLVGAQIVPEETASTHVVTEPLRTRKLLLHKKELDKLIGAIERQGYTIVPLRLYWKKNIAKLKIAFAKGKKLHDKRDTAKARDWSRDKARLLKQDKR